MKHFIIYLNCIVFAWCSFAQSAFCQTEQSDKKDNYTTAIVELTKRIEQSPKDADTYYLRAIAYNLQQQYANALADISSAIKYHTKKKGHTLPEMYIYRAEIYETVKDYSLAEQDYNAVIKADKKRGNSYAKRGDFFYRQERYAEAESDYRKAGELCNNKTEYVIETARCLCVQGRYDEADSLLEKIIRYEPQQTEAKRLHAVVKYVKEEWKEFIDEYIGFLSLDTDGDVQKLVDAAQHEYAYALKAISEKTITTNAEVRYYWLGVRARVFQSQNQYTEALADLDAMQAISGDTVVSPYIHYQRALCYYALYDFTEAAKSYTSVINYNRQHNKPFDANLYYSRAVCYSNTGEQDAAIADYTKVIENDINYAVYAYYGRGTVKDEELKDYDGALDDYNKGLLLDNENTGLLLYRGRLLLLQKQDTLCANTDFTRILTLDTVPVNSLRQYALMYMGQYDEAIAWQNRILAGNPEAGDYYDAACLYARMNKAEEALEYLKKAMENGYRGLHRISTDPDLESIRQLPAYEELLYSYRTEKLKRLFDSLKS